MNLKKKMKKQMNFNLKLSFKCEYEQKLSQKPNLNEHSKDSFKGENNFLTNLPHRKERSLIKMEQPLHEKNSASVPHT